jgi:hypothetical protein
MKLGCCEAREPKKPVTVLESFFAVRWITLERPVAGSNELPVALLEPLGTAGWLSDSVLCSCVNVLLRVFFRRPAPGRAPPQLGFRVLP